MDKVTFSEHLVDWLAMSSGVLIAVIFPALSSFVKSAFGATTTAGAIDLKKYGALFAFCAITAILVLAVYRQTDADGELTFFAALLGGYAWEATIEKFTTA